MASIAPLHYEYYPNVAGMDITPVLKPRQVVVMDNATFHKGGRIEQLIQQAGCELLYLPAYSRLPQ